MEAYEVKYGRCSCFNQAIQRQQQIGSIVVGNTNKLITNAIADFLLPDKSLREKTVVAAIQMQELKQ